MKNLPVGVLLTVQVLIFPAKMRSKTQFTLPSLGMRTLWCSKSMLTR